MFSQYYHILIHFLVFWWVDFKVFIDQFTYHLETVPSASGISAYLGAKDAGIFDKDCKILGQGTSLCIFYGSDKIKYLPLIFRKFRVRKKTSPVRSERRCAFPVRLSVNVSLQRDLREEMGGSPKGSGP